MRYHGTICKEVAIGGVRLTETHYAPAAVIRSHAHDFDYVAVVISGIYTEQTAAGPRVHAGDSIVVHAAGERHADYFHRAGTLINVEGLSGCGATAPAVRQVLLDNGVPRTLVDQMLASKIETEATKRTPRSPQWLELVLSTFDWLQGGPIAGAAKSVGVHPVHFTRAFGRYVGVAPGRYRRERRIALASSLLVESSASLACIAQRSGFSDQSHFANAFRARAGMPPGEYRRVFGR